MLSELSGATHSVITAVTLILPSSSGEPQIVEFLDETFVTFSKLSDSMIESYVATGTPMYDTKTASSRSCLLNGALSLLHALSLGYFTLTILLDSISQG